MQITGGKPDVSVILIGGNDITARNGLSASASRLGEAVQTLVDSGSKVVVGTCPDLGVIQPVPQPLRSIMHAWSLRLAALQAHQVRSAGGIPVPLSETLTPELRDRPDHFFSADQFHPNSAGYELAAAILLPPTLIALEIWDEDAKTAAADGKVSAGAETADTDDATQVEGSTTEDEVDTTATANDGTVVQQLLWRLVHVVRPGDSDDASGADSDSPFDTEVFDSHRERARAEAAADDSAASGSGSHAYRPGPLPEDRHVSADSADAEARRAAGRFFRLSRFRPGGNRSSGVMGEEKAGSGTAAPDTNGSAEETAELHESRGTEPESRADA